MCTLSFVPTQDGYVIAMNRDELLSRPQAAPPAVHTIAGRDVIYPHDVEGGSWIATDDGGNSWALLNRNPTRTYAKLHSRGEVLLAMVAEERFDLPNAETLTGVLPFRLVTISSRFRQVIEWTWDGESSSRTEHLWQPTNWFSSGKSDSEATRHRGQVFADHRSELDYPSLEWLRRLHRSHEPEPGAFSVCVHRPAAATVSYTEVQVSLTQITMSYAPGSPCGGATSTRIAVNRAELSRR